MPRHTDWTDLDRRARSVLAAHGGVAHVSAFDAAGISRRQVGLLHGRRVIERARIGWFIDPALPWQVKRAVGVGGLAGCVSAAEVWTLPTPPASQQGVHVVVDPQASHLRHSKDRRWVMRSVADDDHLQLHWGALVDPPVAGRTSVVDTLLTLGHCVPFDWFIAALDAALHRPRDGQPILSDAERVRLGSLLPRRLRRAFEHVDADSESVIESLLRLGMIRRGIAPIVLQAQLTRSHRVDFVVRGRLVVEADGAAFHDPGRDRIRDAELTALGYVVLRFDYQRIVFDLEAVLDEIEAALAAL